MFIRYVDARKSWILLFAGLLGLANALILLDQGIQVSSTSILYFNASFILSFLLFFIWRFKRETKYVAALTALQEDKVLDWIETIPEPDNGLDQLTNEIIREATIQFKQQLSNYKENQLIENEFTASWIHEVKTPLTVMKLMLESLPSDPEIRKIEAEWLRVYLLVDRQLHMTRLPAIESDYVLELSSIQRLAAEEVRELAPWCMEKNLAVLIEGTDVKAITDQKWCRFILRQLLTNAVKYSPANTALMIVTDVTETGQVFLDVIDEGPGIQPHELPRIFDKGFTGENGRIQNAATGLGLYLAKTVADKIGITIKALPGQTKGTVMRITFVNPNAFEAFRIEVGM
ncbi:MAG TPA: sensor histidine kinase [Bacillaceae bacterium]|nr:sensor histidine kinase [Bacillaceae bacterium]